MKCLLLQNPLIRIDRRWLSTTPSFYKRRTFKKLSLSKGSLDNPGQRLTGGDILSFDLCTVIHGHKYEFVHASNNNLNYMSPSERGRSIINRPITENDIHQVSTAAANLKKTKSVVPYISERSIRRISLSERYLFYKMRKGSRFLDTIRIKCTGGTGGNGRMGFGPPGRSGYGKPNGGNGGAGGNVYLRTDSNFSSYFGLNRNVKSENGQSGGQNMCSGKAGKDVIIKVPVGTLISVLRFLDVNRPQSTASADDAQKAIASKFTNEDIDVIAKNGISALHKTTKRKGLEYQATTLSLLAQIDMDRPDMLVKVASGGRGGLGNKDFGKFPPNEVESGYLGSSVYFQLDLKTIADVGLVGMPNAGKSSLLTSLSRARPKISPVPFTTLHPNLGVLFPEKENYEDLPVKIADIPGLVEGAHLNIGLGHAFLKHVYRSKVIAYVIDITSNDPFHDFEILQNELKSYDKYLLERPAVIIANKIDLKGAASVNLPKFIEKLSSHPSQLVRSTPVIPFSAKDAILGENKDILKSSLLHVLCKKVDGNRGLPT